MKFAIFLQISYRFFNDTPYSYIIWIYKHTIWKSASDIEYKENWVLNQATIIVQMNNSL